MIDENKQYIHNVKIEDIPWNRLTTAYIRATEFPEYFETIWNLSNSKKVKTTLNTIFSNIEHQSTLWRATPFSMIFLVRIFQKAVSEMHENNIAYDVVKILLKFFIMISELFHEVEQQIKETDEKPLPYFYDMLNEKYLFPEECDDEEQEEIFWEEDADFFSDELFNDFFYSIYYYSYQPLLECKEVLKDIKNVELQQQVKELQNLLY